ncbi:MAG: pseudouridine synthase [Acidobacteriota bacterium]
MPLERLQKIIARAGFASRREAEEMMRNERVTVNGKVVTELGTRADPDADHVKVDGKLITRSEPLRYILLNKPKEVMTTVKDPEGRPTVLDFVRGVRERIFPVGRLDFHSEGLILLTNDGDLAFKIAHPSTGSVKVYSVKVRGIPEERIIDKLSRGITIDGRRTLPCEIERMRTTGASHESGNSWFRVSLREGRTQQIRKMFKAVGHPVSKLKRISIGPISDSSLAAGQWRELSTGEVQSLSVSQKPPRRSPAKPARTAKPARPVKPGRKKAAPRKKAAASPKTSTNRSRTKAQTPKSRRAGSRSSS